jgi:SRSO17 transposase
MPWDAEDLNRQRAGKMSTAATHSEGVLVFDDTGFPKHGSPSGGGARQDSGTLGTVGTCQMAVTCCDSDPQATWPVTVRLYLSPTWTQAPARRQQARVLAEVVSQTKPESALALLDQARAWGGPHRCVVADADDEDNPNFLAGWEARQEPYVVAVQTDVAVRGWRVTSDGARHEGWLVGERATQGQPGERKSFWSHLPPASPLEPLAGYAHRRHAIEPFHEEATGALGWDQYQGRLWLGLHRHTVTVMRAYRVAVWLGRQERPHHTRQGRRRGPVPPFGRNAGGEHCRPCIVRSPRGCATRLCGGG